MKMTEYWVTSTDNPYDPFSQWDDWYSTDLRLGYNLAAYVARDPDVAALSSDAPPLIQQEVLKNAIDMICQFQLTGREGVYFKRVTRVVDTDSAPVV